MNETTASAGILPPKTGWLRENLNYPPLLLLFATGLSLRVILMITYFPALMLSYDSPRYARIDSMPMFGDFWMPAGYPMLLKLLHAISDQVWFTIVVQHIMGLTMGLVIYLVLRYLSVKPWAASLPAGVVFLSGDQLYQEHILMADWFLSFLTIGGLAAAVRGVVPELNWRWLSTGSALLGAASLTRSVGVVLLPILVICTAVWARRLSGKRTVAIAAAVLPGLGIFGLYFAAFKVCNGQYLGLCDMRGWNLYSRIAPFADCRKFDAPEETKILCEERAPADRPGPFGYVWDLDSTPRAKFELGPESSRKMGIFAKRAIVHQPWEYLQAVSVDVAKYIDPTINPRPYSGQPPTTLSFGWRDIGVENLVVRALSKGYRGTAVRLRGQQVLAHYQSVFRLSGLSICVLALFTVLGMLISRGRLQLGIFLFGLSAFALYLLPVATVGYDYRYGIPPATCLVVSGLLGAASIWSRLRDDGELGGPIFSAR